MIMVSPDMVELKGERLIVVKQGLALFKDKFRGGVLFRLVGLYVLMMTLIKHPFTPVYMISKCFSWKSYISMKLVSRRTIPSREATPTKMEEAIVHAFGRQTLRKGEVYDKSTYVLHREASALRDDVAPLTPEDLENPDIRYFVERNPGWQRGMQMVVMSTMG